MQMARFFDHSFIFATVLLGVYGQVVWKWQLDKTGAVPAGFSERVSYFVQLLLNPWIVSGFLGAGVAAICWLIALKKFEMTYAYPFVSLTFPGVLICGVLLFGEDLSWSKMIGTALILAGVVVHTRL